MKKMNAIWLFAVLLASISACSSSPKVKPAADEPATASTTLTPHTASPVDLGASSAGRSL
jgi:uncharacterized lipoprotein